VILFEDTETGREAKQSNFTGGLGNRKAPLVERGRQKLVYKTPNFRLKDASSGCQLLNIYSQGKAID